MCSSPKCPTNFDSVRRLAVAVHCTSLTCVRGRIEDVFEWILEVDEDALGDDRGRIQIIVEYQMNSLSSPRQQQQQQQQERAEHGERQSGGGGRGRGRRHRQRSTSSSAGGGSSVYNRITAHVDIQRDNTYAIVPVVKVRRRHSASVLVSVTVRRAHFVVLHSHRQRRRHHRSRVNVGGRVDDGGVNRELHHH